MQDNAGRQYCGAGCRAMAAIEVESRYYDARESGIELIITKSDIIRLR